MTNNLSSFKTLYITTARQYSGNLKQGLEELMNQTNNEAVIDQVYIDAHSLKSQSLAMGYASIGSLCSIIEQIFREVKEMKRVLTVELLQILIDAIKNVENSILHIEQQDTELDLSLAIQDLNSKIKSL